MNVNPFQLIQLIKNTGILALGKICTQFVSFFLLPLYTAYLSTGWGQQAYGYGFYLIDDYDAARDYACGGQVMEVEVPDGKYLTDKSISMREKQKIANIFF